MDDDAPGARDGAPGPAPGQPGPKAPTHDRARTVLVAGVVLLVAGLITTVVLVLRPVGVADFGWFAYAPLSGEVYLPGVVVVHPGALWGGLVAGAGAVLVSGAVGYRRGRRRRATG
ncbi:hypothetical protein [uncultured Cellulomonas sp.]|uniref:hypothetical protein n=1 Tax=uncultured Cellulomonas sp. TaxID=189682 RepID=UPI0026352289|nr:hypothetical protein [uncultured Cellulomonas sp.]